MALADLIIVAATMFYLMKHRNPDYSRTTRAAVSRILKVSQWSG
jgi:transketolase C-terminal domain/subunit